MEKLPDSGSVQVGSSPGKAEKQNPKGKEEPYHTILSRVVTGLKPKEDHGKKKGETSKKDNSLMGKIRRLANGEYRSSQAPVEQDSGKGSSVISSRPIQASTGVQEKPHREVLWKTMNARTVSEPVEKQKKDPDPVIVAVKTMGFKKDQKPAENELLQIQGIGPSVLKRLERIGICTVHDLASTDVGRLEESFGEYSKLTDLSEWIREAKLKIKTTG